MTTDVFRETDIFKSSLKLSLIAHIVFVLFFSVKAYLFPSEAIDYTAAVRVDIVALPDKLDPSKVTLGKKEAQEEKKETPKPEPKPVAVKKEAATQKAPEPDAINLTKKSKEKSKEKKQEKQQEAALDKLKRMAALDKIKNQLESSKPAANVPNKQVISQVKGNILSPGTALAGLNKLQHDSYISDLDRHIKQNWALPEWLAKRDFKARARVRLDESGQIIGREIIISSGNENYDEIVLETIDRSAPFPAPPEKFVAIVGAQGIVIGFPE